MRSLFSIIPRYMNRNFLINFGLLVGLLLFIVFIFDLIELLRRGGKHDVEFSIVMKMALLKLPEVGQIILPFAILFSAMFTFWRLNRTSELYVMRSIGLSAMQFILPLIVAALCLGAIATTVINPVSSVLLGKFEKLENRYLKKTNSLIILSKSGLWLRQNMENEGYALVNAGRLYSKDWRVENIIILEFDQENNFIRRIESSKGHLETGFWNLEAVKIFTQTPHPKNIEYLQIPTELTPQDILDTFSTVENLSFWKIPEFIKTLQATGFSTERLQVHYQSLIARPFFFAAMILLAAAVSLRPTRQGGTVKMVLIGIGIGFFLFFADSVLKAFGISQKIPIFLAAWTPAIVSILLGGSVLLQQEDG